MAMLEPNAACHCPRATFIGLTLLGILSGAQIFAQDIHPVSSSAVQGERVSQPQGAGMEAIPAVSREGRESLAPAPSENVSSQPDFAGVDKGSEATPRMTEGSMQLPPDPGGNSDFPVTDFVGTMPKPALIDFGPLADTGAAGFGISLTPVPTFNSQSLQLSGSTTREPAIRQIKDADSILNPFTHTVSTPLGGVTRGGGAVKETFLGPAKSE